MISQPSAVSIGGGERPILFASHHEPCLASSTTQWSPQCFKSGEYDSQMFALLRGEFAIGRCNKAHRPPKRRGNSAASLSSGGITAPLRSNSRKSFVNAIDTSGPLVE